MSETVAASLIGGLALIVATWLQRRPSKTLKATKELAQQAVEQTVNTGNGFAAETKEQLDELKKSIGSLHGRLDHRERHSNEAREEIREVIVNFDNRLNHIEEKLT